MPCNTPQGNELREMREEEERKSAPKNLKIAKEHICYLTACLCALFNNLEARNICKDIIASASLDGDVDINAIYEVHKLDDELRMKDLLTKLSPDEKKTLRKVLDKENISDEPIPTPTDSISDTKGL